MRNKIKHDFEHLDQYFPANVESRNEARFDQIYNN